MSESRPNRSEVHRGIPSIPARLRLRSLIFAMTALSIPLAIIVPQFRARPPRFVTPSPAEVRAVRLAAENFRAKYGKNADYLEARPGPDGGWTVEVTSILNPEPGGYRSVVTFRVDADWRCHWISIRAGGGF